MPLLPLMDLLGRYVAQVYSAKLTEEAAHVALDIRRPAFPHYLNVMQEGEGNEQGMGKRTTQKARGSRCATTMVRVAVCGLCASLQPASRGSMCAAESDVGYTAGRSAVRGQGSHRRGGSAGQ